MNRPKRYLSRDSLQGKRASFETLRDYYRDKDWMTDRIDQFEWDVKMMEKMTPYAAITYLRKRVGYDEYLKEYCISRHLKITDLSEILSELEEAAKPYETMEEWFSHIEEYTEALKKREMGRNTPEKGIRLMTIHAAKGLEFDTVFVIQANEGRIPYKKAEKAEEIEEERRLFLCGNDEGKEPAGVQLRENKRRERNPSFPLCGRIVGKISLIHVVQVDITEVLSVCPCIKCIRNCFKFHISFDIFKTRFFITVIDETV